MILQKLSKIRLYFSSLAIVLVSSQVSSQGFNDFEMKFHQTVTSGDTTIDFFCLPSDKEISTKKKRVYSWYGKGQVHETVGNYSGQLIDGSYEERNPDASLIRKGDIKKGLKRKQWLYWYANGKLKATYKYSKGYKKGKYKKYNNEGFVFEKGRYKKDLLHGKVKRIDAGGNYSSFFYKRGILNPDKKPINKTVKAWFKKDPAKSESKVKEEKEKKEKKPLFQFLKKDDNQKSERDKNRKQEKKKTREKKSKKDSQG